MFLIITVKHFGQQHCY